MIVTPANFRQLAPEHYLAHQGRRRLWLTSGKPRHDVDRPLRHPIPWIADGFTPCDEEEQEERAFIEVCGVPLSFEEEREYLRVAHNERPEFILSDDAADQLADSWETHRGAIRRYFHNRLSFLAPTERADATDYCESEAYARMIDYLLSADDTTIPTTRREWLRRGVSILRDYMRFRAPDGRTDLVRRLTDGDSNLSTKIGADRLRLDDDHFADLMAQYAGERYAYTARDLATFPDATDAELGELWDCSPDAARKRRTRCIEAIRASVVGALLG